MTSIGIAGAGLLGRTIGWRLQRRGHQVTLFEAGRRDDRTSAGRIAAGMLAPYAEVPHGGTRLLHVGRAALERWPELLAELEGDGGTAVVMERRGAIMVAHPADAGDLRQFRTDLASALGPACPAARELDAHALGELEPALAERFDGGLHLVEEGYLDNDALFPALARALDALGAHWREATPVERLTPGAVDTAEGRERFDVAIDCRGAAARGEVAGLRGVRGEVLRVRAPEVSLARPVRLMHPRYRLYVVPRPQQRYVVGATEIESESLNPVTVRACLELLSALYSLHPGFAEASVEAADVALRPAFPDQLPRISARDGLIVANGLYRHGYQLAPAVAEAVVALVEDRPPPADGARFVERTEE